MITSKTVLYSYLGVASLLPHCELKVASLFPRRCVHIEVDQPSKMVDAVLKVKIQDLRPQGQVSHKWWICTLDVQCIYMASVWGYGDTPNS